MKVLWFANTACAGQEYIDKNRPNSSGGGWLMSLDKAIQSDIELHVAFTHPKVSECFVYGKAHYYPIYKGNFYLNAIKNVFLAKVEDNENMQTYLDLIHEIKPEIIHIHGTENPFGCIIGKVDIPVLVSIQGNITVYLHKYTSGIERRYLRTMNKLSLRALLSGLYPFKRGYDSFVKMSKVEIRNLKGCRHIMGRTDWDKRITRVLAPRSEYHYGGEILRRVFYNAKWQPHNRQQLIINTTNGSSFYKGFETICQSVQLLNELGVDFEWRVAGIANEDLIVKIVKRKLGVDYPQKNMALMGRLSDTQLVDTLLDADMYVMSSHIENSPNNLCEAMLLGVPCIATFAGGTGSMLSDKEQGLLIQDGDPWAMAGAILEFMSNPELAQNLGAKARELAHQKHNPERIAKDIMNVYKKIIDDENHST